MIMAYELSKPKVEDKSQSLMCAAHGCPMLWSVDTEGRRHLCSYHAWTDAKEWPIITENLRMDGPWDLKPYVRLPTCNETGPKAWAYRLKAKDEASPHSVTPTIRKMYREALRLAA